MQHELLLENRERDERNVQVNEIYLGKSRTVGICIVKMQMFRDTTLACLEIQFRM